MEECKTRSIGSGFKLYCHNVNRKRNSVGVILKKEYPKSAVKVKRVPDTVMSVKMKVESLMINC